MTTRIVAVKSAWASKINWTQAVAFVAMMLTMFGIDIPADMQAQIMAAIVAVNGVVTWALRTFFTTTITAPAAG